MISPWLVGATAPQWQFTIADQTGKAVDLTSVVAANIVLTFRNTSNLVETAGTGTFTLGSPATSGTLTYAQSSADVATAGTYDILVAIPMPSGGTLKRLYAAWQLLPV